MPETSNSGVEHATGRRPDRGVVVLGLLVALTPSWVSVTAGAVATLVVLGVLIVASALWSMKRPTSASSEYTHVILGVLLFVAPWVMGYTSDAGASWISWIVGLLVVLTGLGALRVVAEADKPADSPPGGDDSDG